MMTEYKPAFKQGLRMAIVSILLFVVLYAIDPMFYAKWQGWVVALVVNMLALPIVFMILGAKGCKPNFTPFTFGNAFNAAFFTGIVSIAIVLVFNIIFVTIIDTSWEQEFGEEILNSTEGFMEWMGAPQEAIDEAMEKARADASKQSKGILEQLKQTGKWLFWYIILALVIGAIQKERKKEDTLVV
ncbi:MAG: hypothetical protein COA58_09385 [Bacteroidetes bacterium]|nr:MAG: hypothetical protein COA58_09385 [Bacteroidota bacterium]